VIQETEHENEPKFKILAALTGKVSHFHNMEEETQTSEFLTRDLKVEQNIYALAFAAQLNPDELECDNHHMPPIKLMDEERENIFLSAMLVTSVQVTSILLISYYFDQLRKKGPLIKPALNF